jgi:hypothetical protein
MADIQQVFKVGIDANGAIKVPKGGEILKRNVALGDDPWKGPDRPPCSVLGQHCGTSFGGCEPPSGFDTSNICKKEIINYTCQSAEGGLFCLAESYDYVNCGEYDTTSQICKPFSITFMEIP